MKIAIGLWQQEVNAFSPVPTTLETFERAGILYGQDVIERSARASEIAGFVACALERAGVEILPTLSAWTMPSGPVTREARLALKQRLLERLRGAGRLDGILLALHGAMVAEDEPDVEGDLLAAIRAEWGAGVPVAVTLDHHGCVTRRMVENSLALVGYRTEPHLDQFEVGRRAARILLDTIGGALRPVTGWSKLPMIAAGDLRVPDGPLGPHYAVAEALERQQGVLAASIFPEYFYADSPELGWSVVVVADDARALAEAGAQELARGLWRDRQSFMPVGWPAPRVAVEQALAIEGGPVVLADFGDTTTGGAPGDSTAILKELLAHELPGRALVTVVDAQTVEAAIAVGVGNELTAELGGKIDRKHHTPVRVTGRVRAISDGRYVMADGPVPGPADMKRTVVLEVGSLSIVVSEQAGPVLHPALYRSVGLEPADASIVVVKSAYSFRAAYAPFARAMIMVNSPGVTSADLRSNAHLFRLAPRPLYPLDDDATF